MARSEEEIEAFFDGSDIALKAVGNLIQSAPIDGPMERTEIVGMVLSICEIVHASAEQAHIEYHKGGI